jgi:UPF0176 protein
MLNIYSIRYDEEVVRHTIAAFYRFTPLQNPEQLCSTMRQSFHKDELRGTMLIAPEGVNGTMAGSAETIERLLQKLHFEVGLERADVKFSSSEEPPFGRLKFRLKQEIIAFRKAAVDPSKPGTYIEAQDWNDLLSDPEVTVLDTRNGYETDIGTFTGAIKPGIETFSDFATYVRENLDPAKHRKVAMFCTGGIRCEKASAFMLQEGFGEVYHLKGGILKYLEEIPEQESRWEGTCYVFDRRVAVGHGLTPETEPQKTTSKLLP